MGGSHGIPSPRAGRGRTLPTPRPGHVRMRCGPAGHILRLALRPWAASALGGFGVAGWASWWEGEVAAEVWRRVARWPLREALRLRPRGESPLTPTYLPTSDRIGSPLASPLFYLYLPCLFGKSERLEASLPVVSRIPVRRAAERPHQPSDTSGLVLSVKPRPAPASLSDSLYPDT